MPGSTEKSLNSVTRAADDELIAGRRLTARRLLPPMAALHCFAAAARLGNFSHAGNEIGLTQSAVSRQIAQLENWLGVRLFDRVGRQVALTPEGKAYAEAISLPLQRIRLATGEMIDRDQRREITVAILPSFGMRWLAPRLPGLTALHPDLIVNFAAQSDIFDFAASRFEAAIHFGLPNWPGAMHDELFCERAIPVGSASMRDRLESDRPEAMRDLPLLHLTTRPHAWKNWFAQASATAAPLAASPSFDHFLMLAQAAAAGAGAALIPSFLIGPELASGALVRLSPLTVTGAERYYFVYPPERLANKRFRDFRQWLLDEAALQSTEDEIAAPSL